MPLFLLLQNKDTTRPWAYLYLLLLQNKDTTYKEVGNVILVGILNARPSMGIPLFIAPAK